MAGEKEKADRNVVPLDEEAKKKKSQGLIEDTDRERLKNSPLGDLSDVAMTPATGSKADPATDLKGGGEPKKLGGEPGTESVSEDDSGAEEVDEVAMERYRSIKEELEALGEELGIEEGGAESGVSSSFSEEDIKGLFKETNPQARIKKLDEFLGNSASPNLPAPLVLNALNRQLIMVKKDYSEGDYAVAYGRIEALGEILTDIERYYSSNQQ